MIATSCKCEICGVSKANDSSVKFVKLRAKDGNRETHLCDECESALYVQIGDREALVAMFWEVADREEKEDLRAS